MHELAGDEINKFAIATPAADERFFCVDIAQTRCSGL